ncbi:MAG: LacI family DNA-binding transcriptional regulator [Pyrinomonadaceae bacterium]|nr:LacI family DNA-binding transcriptional regulator [Phycisphaerales bacterium]
MAKRPCSIQDVADAAGVSTATVSRVLNNADLVAPATAAKVQEAVKSLGYKPNLFAQGLMTRKSHVLGFALPDIFGEFYSELLRGADAEAHRLGYNLLVSSEAHTRAEQERRGSLAFGLIDGLAVMITEPNESLWKESLDTSMPMVVLDADLRDHGIDSIVVDNASGTREAMLHLLASVPAERCYFVGGPRENFDSQQRAAAFSETLAREKAMHVMRNDQIAHGDYSLDWGERWAMEMHAQGTLAGAGVLAGNDEIALGILQTARQLGVEVPSQLKLVGFDDTRLASLVRPSLSTVRVPLAEVGAAAIRALVDRIEGPERPPRTVTLATKLVVRESSV